MIIGVKGQSTEKMEENICKIKYLVKNLSGTSKEVLQLNNEITTQFLNGKNIQIGIYPRNAYKSLVGIWKDVQLHSSSNYCLSKPWLDTGSQHQDS